MLTTKAWYLHSNREGKLYFKNVQNLVAKLKTTAESLNRESSLKQLRTFLGDTFKPISLKDCYQEVLVFPAVDEINIKSDKVTLVVCEPDSSSGLPNDLVKFYEDLDYKNRILFLSGSRNTLESLLENAAELKAIASIIAEMESEKVPDNDPQLVAARDIRDNIQLRLLSAMREAFTTLTYPSSDGLLTADFLMNFTDNDYNGEKQIRESLKAKQKFTEDVASDSFRKKCEARLFTQKAMPWTEIKKRAAMNPQWQWHRMDALDELRTSLILKDQWREEGGYTEKPPFPKPQTDIRWYEAQRDDETGEVTLKLTAVHGDTIYYEIGAPATTASQQVADPKNFKTQELAVSFLCVDFKGEHEAGEARTWRNRITLKSICYQNGSDKMVELRSAPATPIRYTTDGSDPKNAGGSYAEPFVVLPGTVCVLAIAEKNGLTSDVHRRDIRWEPAGKTTVEIKPESPAVWKRPHHPSTTKDAYEFMGRLKKFQAEVAGGRITISGENWLELSIDDRLKLDSEKLETTINHLRSLLTEGEVEIEVDSIRFPNGQLLLDWVAEAKTEVKPDEVLQTGQTQMNADKRG